VKVGYAGQNFPSFIYPSMIGRPILRAEEAVSDTLELKEVMCGDEAAAVRQSLEIKYPVCHPPTPSLSCSTLTLSLLRSRTEL
jgi:actin-related protein 2